MNTQIKSMVNTGMFAALIFVATYFFKIPTPFGYGYIHLGDCMIFLAAYHLGGKRAALAAGIGSALSDYLGGFTVYVLPTLLIKGLMGYIAGFLLTTKNEKITFTTAYVGIVTLWSTLIIFLLSSLNNYKDTDTHLELATALGNNDVTQIPSLIATANISLYILLLSVPVVLLVSWIVLRGLYRNARMARTVFAASVAGLWMVMGYFVTGYILYHSYVSSIFMTSFDVLQFVIGIILAQALLQITSRILPTYGN